MVHLLEDRTLLEDLLTEMLEVGGVQVIIGGEGRWNELKECSLVVSPYGVSGEATGALGVMGPMRMPYSRAISTVRYVAGLMSDLFRDLYGERRRTVNAGGVGRLTEEQSRSREQSEVEAESRRLRKTEHDGEQAEEPVDELAALRQELEETQAQEAEYLDGWQRARAELANARKRFQREQRASLCQRQGRRAGPGCCPSSMILSGRSRRCPRSWPTRPGSRGVLLIQRKLQRLLEQEGVAPIEAVGQEFDPFAHQAVTHEPSDDVPEGHVIAELQKGYTAGRPGPAPQHGPRLVWAAGSTPRPAENQRTLADDEELAEHRIPE